MTKHIAFYGSLMRQYPTVDTLDIRPHLKYVKDCYLKGALYDVSDRPAVVSGASMVFAELYEVLDHWILEHLDAFLSCYPDSPSRSKYLRVERNIMHSDESAWVYLYQGAVSKEQRIINGNWYLHKERK